MSDAIEPEIETFAPHPFVRGGHLQTLVPFLFPGTTPQTLLAERRIVPLPDGDALSLHDDKPEFWRPSDATALMLHGLAGCHLSPYMVRVARKLNASGVRAFRMNARTAGDGMSLARYPYHAGRSSDVLAAIRSIEEWCPGSPILLIGFSLGGVVMLKLAGELETSTPTSWKGLLAVCPPIDLNACVRRLRRPGNRLYDWYFCRLLRKHLDSWRAANPNAVTREFRRPPRRLLDFDEEFTAPLGGFESAEHYYRSCSPNQFLNRIAVSTTILASCNDPLAPGADLVEVQASTAVTKRVEPGGHLGFFARHGLDGRRWLDSYVDAWAKSVLRANGSSIGVT
jgi:uncharacterized protein